MTSTRNRRMTLSSIPEPAGSSRSARRKSIAVAGNEAPLPPHRANAMKPPVPTSSVPSGRRKSMIPRPGRENRENAPPLPPKSAETFGNALSPSASSQVSHRSRMSFGSKRMHGNSQPTDVRPATDRKFVQKCVADLLKFLQDNQYNMKVSSKILSQLSSSDIENISKHIFRLIDSDFQKRSPLKFVDEVVHGFRLLGYPYTISRTSWASAQTTPIILALHWLSNQIGAYLEEESVDYLFTEDLTFENFEELHDNTESAFFQYLKQAFTAFMKQNNPDIEGLERALMNRFHHDDVIVSHQTDRLCDENADILQEVEELQQNEQLLAEVKQKYEDWEEKIEKMKIVVHDMKEYRQKNEEKKGQDLADLKEAEAALAQAEQQLKDLKQAISEQTTSVEDIQKIDLQSKGYLESLQRFEESIKEQNSNLFKKQSELNQVVSELEVAVHELTNVSGQISLHGETQTLHLRFNSDALKTRDGQQIFATDLRNGKEVLVSLRADGEAELQSNKSTIEALLDQLTEKQVALKRTQSKLGSVNVKVEHTKKSLFAVQERQDLCRQEMISLEDETNQALEREAALEREIIALEAKMRRSSDDHALAIAAKYREIDGSIECMDNHLAYMDTVVSDVDEYYKTKRQEVRDLEIRQDDE